MTEQIAQIVVVAALAGFYWFSFIALVTMNAHYTSAAEKVVILGLAGMSGVCAVCGTCVAIGRAIALFF